MKKNEFLVPLNRNWKKLLLTMKLCLLFLLISATSLLANSGYSQNTILSIHLKNATLRDLISEVEKQSEFIFVFYDKVVDLDMQIDVQVDNQTIDKVLDEIFKSSELTYRIFDRQIGIGKRDPVTGAIVLPTSLDELVTADKKLTGVVKDIRGEPVPGATVVVKGTTIGTITDTDGQFSLSVPVDAKILLISFVGMKSQEFQITEKTTFNVVMEEKTVELDELVVVAYGTQKKISVTGAVASVSSNELRRSSSASLANALAGRLSGLTSLQSNGSQPGRDDALLTLRGKATTNGTNPLILIDGVPRDNIRTLDFDEVESVSVLKDASATAVFGVRGANGVIIVTTKRGVEGKPEFSITAEQTYISFTAEPERLHSLEYMKLRNEASANDKISPLPFSEALMAKYANPLAGLDPNDPDYARKATELNYMYPDHDYYREAISRYAPQTRISASASGGTEKTTYFVNATYLHQGGNLITEPKSALGYDPASKMDRFSFRVNLDYKVSNTVKAFLNLGNYIEKVNMPCVTRYGTGGYVQMMGDVFYHLLYTTPITPGSTTLPGFGVAPGETVDPGYLDRSAFEIINRQGYQNEVRSNLVSSFGLDWDLGRLVTKGLSVKGMISFDTRSTSEENGAGFRRLYGSLVNTTTDQLSFPAMRPNETRLALTKNVTANYTINMQGSVNYSRKFGEKHNVGGMILAQRDYWETNAGEIPYNVLGLCSRITYDYDNRYLAEVNMGYNGSEQFAPGNRYGFFPAISLGWVASNEKFLKDNRIVTNLKLRASYGKVGSDQMGTARFLYQSNIASASGGFSGSLGKGQLISQGLLGNSNLSWEVAKKQNYGVDIQFVKDLNLTFDYFIENRTDILIARGTVPTFQGVPLANIPKVNWGKVDNHGYEVEIKYHKTIAKDLSVMVTANYSFNRNKVKFIDEQIRDTTYSMRYATTGLPLQQAAGYKIDYSNGNGYFNSQEELDAYLAVTKYSFGTPRVGDFKYIDQNGDGTVNDKDIVPIGYSNNPEVTYGMNLNLQYKSFEFTAFFQGVGHYSTYYNSQGVWEHYKRGTYLDYHKTAWTAERYANGETITYPALSTRANTNHQANDFFIMDRSYIRLRNIELAYTLPAGALKLLGIAKMRVFVSADNYFTWAPKWRLKHIDPENVKAFGYPTNKMANIGMNITF